MIPIITLLLILFISLIATRIATIALVRTGMSKNNAQFQARSALSTCGFTTSESEQIMNHPIRRKIIMLLMMLGNIGAVTVLSSLMLTFIKIDSGPTPIHTKMLILFGGLLLLWLLMVNKWVERQFAKFIHFLMDKFTDMETGNYRSLINIHDSHKIVQIKINPESPIIGKTYQNNELKQQGLVVLSVQKANGDFIGYPKSNMIFSSGDIVTIYGEEKDLEIIKDLNVTFF